MLSIALKALLSFSSWTSLLLSGFETSMPEPREEVDPQALQPR